jgi:hypothetical protein
MKRRASLGPQLAVASATAICPISALADGFLPTMISANALWVVALPLVVAVEGWFMVRWKWEEPYKNSLRGNLLSMFAALPIGIALSVLGWYLVSNDGQATLGFIPTSARELLGQTFLYGQLPAPSYGFIDEAGNAGIYLAALLFMGICLLLTFGVESYYYRKKNPQLSRGTVFCQTAIANLISYLLLFALWIPYSYHSASAADDFWQDFCRRGSGWSSACTKILGSPWDGKRRMSTLTPQRKPTRAKAARAVRCER